MATIEFADKIANMWKSSRQMAGKSQEYVAKCLGVSKKTVQNWEEGTASPSFRKGIEWFDAIGVPMYPFLLSILHTDDVDGVNADSSIEDITKALHVCVDELDDFHKHELLYLLYGSHGSSPTGTLDMITSYLHTPLAMRVCIAESILTNYEIANAVNMIRIDGHVMPKLETVQRCVKTAKQAVLSGKETYVVTEVEE